MTKKLSQKQALRKLNKNSESKKHHLTALWEKYSRAALSSEKLLEELGKLTKNFSKAQLKEIQNDRTLKESS